MLPTLVLERIQSRLQDCLKCSNLASPTWNSFFFFHYVHKAVVGTAKIYQDKLDDEEFALKKFAIY